MYMFLNACMLIDLHVIAYRALFLSVNMQVNYTYIKICDLK